LILALFIYIYCGIGVGYATKHFYEYEIYYSLYVIILSWSLYIFCKKDIKIPISENINIFSIKYSSAIIIVYILLSVIPLAQSGNIGRLINPPSVDLRSLMESKDFSQNQISNILNSIRVFFYPLFLLSLYRYVKQPIKLIAIFMFTCYIDYCQSAYIGRGTMLLYFAFLVLYIYIVFPKTRKTVIVVSLILIPTIVTFFESYLSIRLGGRADKLSFGDSLTALIGGETYYYNYFDVLTGGAPYLINYLIWLITLPLPGFLKPIDLNFNFNALFTLQVLGQGSLSDITSISLPGLVNESIFIFGKYLFFVHAIIFAFIISVFYDSLKGNKKNLFPLIYTMFTLSMYTPRGGTSGPYSGAVKILFVFFLFYLFRSKRKKSLNSVISMK
jgi:hypothetical protein